MPFDDFSAPPVAKTKVIIHYCNLCRWMLRAAWLAQELLGSFPDELDEVALHPGSGGVFAIWVNDVLVWERQRDGGFPEAKVLKQRVRDIVSPDRDLGHSDTKANPPPL